MRSSDAPIRKLKSGKKRWMLDLRYLGGKRECFLTRQEAENIREIRLSENREHGTSALAFSHADRVAFSIARDRLAKLGATIEQAVAFFEQHHTGYTPQPLDTAAKLLYEIKLATNKRQRSARTFFYTVSAFARQHPEKLVSDITGQDVEKWLFKSGWKPATIRTKRIDLQTFFRAALARRWTTKDPTAHIESIELDDKPPGILTVEQCRALLRAAQKEYPELCGYIALALFAGIRPEELAKMQTGDVKGKYAEVRAEVAKTRQRRLVELSDNCRAWINVGLDLPGKHVPGKMLHVREAAGIESSRKKQVKGKQHWVRIPGDPWPHDAMRHSFGSYHLAMHGSADKTAVQMGHRSTDMLFRHYRELVTKEEAKKFWNIFPT